MKRFVLLFCLLLLLSFSAPELRHVQGFQGGEVTAGVTSMGPLLSIAYSRYINRTSYWKCALSGQHRHQDGVLYQSFSVHPALCWCFWQPAERCYFNLLGAVLLTYEGHHERGSTTDNFNIALAAGTEIEYFLNTHLAILIALAPHYYFLNSPYGHWGYQGCVGVKLCF